MIYIVLILLIILCGLLAYYRPVSGILSSIVMIMLIIALRLYGHLIRLPQHRHNHFLSEAEMYMAILFTLIIMFAAVLFSKNQSNYVWKLKKGIKWFLFVVGSIVIFISGIAIFGPLGYLFVMLYASFAGLMFSFVVSCKHSTALTIFSTIGSSLRQNLPLPMAIKSAAYGRKDSAAHVLNRIHKWLIKGYSISSAIKMGYPNCPSDAFGMIKAAEYSGSLPAAFKVIEDNIIAKVRERSDENSLDIIYPLVVFTATFFVTLGLMTFVMPKFSAVLWEVAEAPLPVSTQIMIRISDVIHHNSLLISVIILFVIFVIIPFSIRVKFRQRRPGKPYITSIIGDHIKWFMPIKHWFEYNNSVLGVVEMLRLSLTGGQTVDESIESTLKLDINLFYKKKLKKWLSLVRAGGDIAASAESAGIYGAIVWAFSQKGPDNTLLILETLERLHRSNYSYKVNLLRFIMTPLIIVILGCMVGFVCFASFTPLVQIIYYLANNVMP